MKNSRIGSNLYLYLRMLDHLAYRSSNLLFQLAFNKILAKNVVVYAYAPYNLPKIIDIEKLLCLIFFMNNNTI
jgi:hypothetical protein